MRFKNIKKLADRTWFFHEVFAIAIAISFIVGAVIYFATPSDPLYIEKHTTLIPIVVWRIIVPIQTGAGGYYVPRNLYYAINVTLACAIISIFIIGILMALNKIDL